MLGSPIDRNTSKYPPESIASKSMGFLFRNDLQIVMLENQIVDDVMLGIAIVSPYPHDIPNLSLPDPPDFHRAPRGSLKVKPRCPPRSAATNGENDWQKGPPLKPHLCCIDTSKSYTKILLEVFCANLSVWYWCLMCACICMYLCQYVPWRFASGLGEELMYNQTLTCWTIACWKSGPSHETTVLRIRLSIAQTSSSLQAVDSKTWLPVRWEDEPKLYPNSAISISHGRHGIEGSE